MKTLKPGQYHYSCA